MKHTIRSRWDDNKILFEGEFESLVLCVLSAVREKADLRGADLRGADLYGADLYGAYLREANLYGANLRWANLREADLREANLREADLCEANLHGADLCEANLHGANLRGANFREADLCGAKNSALVTAMTRILPEGSLIGWKKCQNEVLVKLLIPRKAKRSHAFGRKCRAEYARVLEVIGAEVGLSTYKENGIPFMEYRKGKIIKPTQPFCEDFTQECESGIHFYITRIEAENH